jgi:hypothetical protein
MNLMQHEALCLCCSDLIHYRRKVEEISEKINLLRRISYNQSIDYRKYNEFKMKFHQRFFVLQNDSTHCDFICGKCRKINNELSLMEDQLRNILWKVFFLIYSFEDESLYHNTLNILRGDYPITFYNLEELWYNRKR